MIRLLIVLACGLALSGPAALAQGPGGFGTGTDIGTCSSCDKVITWTGGPANAPKRCPHCRVKIGYVDNDDGTQTSLDTGRTYPKVPAGCFALVILAVVVGVAAVAVVKVMAEEKATRPDAHAKMSRAAKRRREFEAESAARQRPPAPAAHPDDDAPIKIVDDEFEVVEDAPPPVPPRRAKAKLLPPEKPRDQR